LKKLPAFLLLTAYRLSWPPHCDFPKGVYNYKFTSEYTTRFSQQREKYGDGPGSNLAACLSPSRTHRPRISSGKLKQTPALR